MAVYKVPQDVEAEDKLIGPFGFRQFIYLLIAGGAGGLTFLMFQAPVPVPFFSVLTVPVGVVMIILALPLKKDQPMEIYVAAVLRFMLKPKRRLWMNDGTAAGVTIDAPRVIQRQLSKDLTQDQALNQLSYLSRIVDTQGWAVKGVDAPGGNFATATTVPAAFDPDDIMDENAGVSKSFDDLLAKQKQSSRQAAVENMRQLQQQQARTAAEPAVRQPQTAAPASQQQSSTVAAPPSPRGNAAPSQLHDPHVRFNPYPNMHQQVLSPLDRIRGNTFQAPAAGATTTDESDSGTIQNKDMTPPVSPDIMRLANNNDLSIQAIANEAHRLSKDDEEVVIKLH